MRSLVIWDHTVLPATWQGWFSRLYPGVLPVLIYRPRKDERLSWPEHRAWTVGSELLRDDITGAKQYVKITGANCSSSRSTEQVCVCVCERLAQGCYLAVDRPRLEPATFRSLILRFSHYHYSKCESKNPTRRFSDIFPKTVGKF